MGRCELKSEWDPIKLSWKNPEGTWLRRTAKTGGNYILKRSKKTQLLNRVYEQCLKKNTQWLSITSLGNLYSHIQTLLPIRASDHFKTTVISFGVQFTISPNDCHNCFPGYVIKPLQLILTAAAPLLNFPKYFHITSLICSPTASLFLLKSIQNT